MDRATIAKLATEAAQGNRDAFQELYQLTKQRVYFVAISITKNETDAQDIVQESYLKAMQNIGQLEQPESFASWLARITANQAKNYISRKKPAAFSEREDARGDEWLEETDRDFLPDERLDLDETKKLIAELVGELPEDQRLCVLLHYFDEMEVGAIAETLSVPEGTVKSRLSRARGKLLQKLEQAQKKGLKLYGLAPIPLLAYLIQQLAQDSAAASDRLPPLVLAGTAAAAGTVAASTSASASSSGGTAAGAAAVAAGALPKVIAAVAIAGIAIGGAAAGVTLANRNAEKQTAPLAAQTNAGQPEYSNLAPSIDENGDVVFPPMTTPQGETVTDSSGAVVPDRGTNAPVPPNSSEARTSVADNGQSVPAGDTNQAQNSGNQAEPTAEQPTASVQGAQSSMPATPTTTGKTGNATATASTVRTQNTPDPTQAPNPQPVSDNFEGSDGCLTKYIGSDSVVTVPAVMNGSRVTELGNYLFAMNPNIREVTIEDGITSIEQSVFSGCASLTRVTIPTSVTYIDALAFAGSPNVKVHCVKGSYADSFAARNGIPVVYI